MSSESPEILPQSNPESQGRIEVNEFFPGVSSKMNDPNAQKIPFDAIATSEDDDKPTVISILGELNEKRRSIKTCYKILPDGTVIKEEYDPNNPERVVEKTTLEDVIALGTITTYGPPEKKL